MCDERLLWFRLWLNEPQNANWVIDKPGYLNGGCNSYCTAPDYFPPNWPIKQLPDPTPPSTPGPLQDPPRQVARSMIGWIILGSLPFLLSPPPPLPLTRRGLQR